MPSHAAAAATTRLQRYLNTTLESALLNQADATVSSSKTPWSLSLTATNTNGSPIKVYTSATPASSSLRFRVVTVINASPKVVFKAMNIERLSWDGGMASLQVLRKWPASAETCPTKPGIMKAGESSCGDFNHVVYATKPALGGSISSRVFEEVRYFYPRGYSHMGFVVLGMKEVAREYVAGSRDPDFDQVILAPPYPTKNVRATNLEAAQFLTASGGGTIVTSINCTAIGGWLPVSTVNGATSQSIVDSMKAVTRYIEEEGGGRGGEEGESDEEVFYDAVED